MSVSNVIQPITFYVMSKKGYLSLREIIKNFPTLVHCVISSRDANVVDDCYDEIKALCLANKISFYDRQDHYNDETPYSVAVSWRWMITKSSGKLIVLHDSLLPKYRGFNPLVSCLINGETQIGVTAIFSSENYDEGDIISQSSRKISYPIKVKDAIDFVSECYVEILLGLMEKFYNREAIASYKQDDANATYSLWRDDKDYSIDWHREASYIQRFVNAMGYPYMGARTTVNGQIIRIHDV
jgi:methionyl-tRNA formyltransferase